MSLRAALLVFAFAATLSAQKKPVTIDALTAAPPRQRRIQPVWAPDGKRFAFTDRNRIMLYDVPAKSEKELVALDPLDAAAVAPPEPELFGWQNRRVAEEPFEWSGDGKELLITRKGDIFIYHVTSSKWDQLTATNVYERNARLSPDNRHVAFRREHDLYVLDVATKAVTRLTTGGKPELLNGELDWVYPEELDLGVAFWWSGDSQNIAYLQFDTSQEFVYPQVDLRGLRAHFEPERYPQAGTPNADVRLGVIGIKGGETRWMDLGESRGHLLARVWWTPDSKNLAVVRLNRVQNELDLMLASASSGQSHSLLNESDRYWINITSQFKFLDGSRFIWSSERDGFRHLYLYSMTGKQLARLTEGNWSVTSLAGVDEKREIVYYVSSESSPLEHQLYSVRFDGSHRTQLTRTAGTHDISMSPTSDYFVDSFSNLTTPPRRAIHTIEGKEWLVLQESDRRSVDDYDVQPTEIVKVKASDGTDLYARLVKPSNFDPKQKYPAIVMVYGGPGAQSIRNAWAGLTWDQLLADKGFVIWQLDNRGSAGRGHAFETPLYHHFGKIELEDQREGLKYLIGQGYVDPARIGIYGWSYGGYMTLYSLLNAPELFKAGIAGAPVTNWRNYDTIYTERYMGLPSENEEGYKASSAVTYADKLKGTLLIVHNIEDDNVLFQNSLQMAAALESAGKTFSMVPFPQKSHGVAGPLRKDLLQITTDFFEKNLK